MMCRGLGNQASEEERHPQTMSYLLLSQDGIQERTGPLRSRSQRTLSTGLWRKQQGLWGGQGRQEGVIKAASKQTGDSRVLDQGGLGGVHEGRRSYVEEGLVKGS